MKQQTTPQICPVCGYKTKKGSLIFHMKKKAVFEVYQWVTTGPYPETKIEECPHEQYILDHSIAQTKFTI